MKNIYYFLVTSVFFTDAKAQQPPTGENISLDQQLSNIGQMSVTSGIIYERVVQAADLYNFNRSTTFNTANYTYFKQALSEMNRASNGSKFVTLETFKSMIGTTTVENQVDLAILNTQFHILNFNETIPAQGGMTYNTSTNKFTAISNRPPFHMLQASVIAPAKDHVTGTSITYKIRNDLYFRNGTKNIKTLIANFGDGVNRMLISNSILSNQTIVVNYTSSGEKVSTFIITYNDNSTLTTYGKIYFKYLPATNPSGTPPVSGCFATDPYKQDFTLFSDIPFTGYATGDPTIKAKIDYRIFYANPDKKLRKPIIIVDGFDPGDKRKIEDCDCEQDNDCAARCITNGQFDAEKHRSMSDVMEYYNGLEQKLILPQLRSLGYDIILVNHPTYTTTNIQNGQQVTIDGGAYYIESNAYALVKLLTQTKAVMVANGSQSKIAVVGPSMGGQISRFALSYMEKNNIPHNTYLWVSVDSPHLGANIPMGDQALIYLLKEGGVDQAATFYNKELSSPAAQQQLIEFHRNVNGYHAVEQNMMNAQTTSQGMNQNRGNSFFQLHYNAQNANGLPNSNGWPQNLRKIALSNGSLSASRETMAPNGTAEMSFANDSEKVLNLRGFQQVDIDFGFGSVNWDVHVVSLESEFLPSYGSGSSQIARFKKLNTNKTVVSPNINPRGNMDNVPGGYYGAQSEISAEVGSGNPIPGESLNWTLDNLSATNILYTLSRILGGADWDLHEYNPNHSFIPTFSSLAHLQPNQNWNNPLDRNLKCPGSNSTPFDSYFGLAKNTQHTSFTKESVDWLIKELAGQPQLPYFPVRNDAILGPSILCSSVNTSYTIIDICKVPGPAVWTVQGNLTILSQTGYSVLVKANSNAPSEALLIGTFGNGLKVQKPIHIGTPTIGSYAINGGAESVNVYSQSIVNIAAATSVNNYQWTIIPMYSPCITSSGLTLPGSVLPSTTSNGPLSAIINWGNCAGQYRIRCQAINVCGSSYYSDKVVTVNAPTSPPPCPARLVVSPNPLKNDGQEFYVNIVAPIEPGPCPPSLGGRTIKVISIFDGSGKQYFTGNYNSDSVTLSGLNIKEGYFILHAELSSGELLKQNFVVRN